MKRVSSERGFTLIEILVVMGLLSILAVGFYTVLFSGVRAADTTEDLSTISQEARLGFNRMIRDTREARQISSMTPTSYVVEIDYDSNGVISAAAFERVIYGFDAAGQRITISNGVTTETLMAGVTQIPGRPVFTYFSNRLEFDSNSDGVTDSAELTAAAASGATLGPDYQNALVTDVRYAFDVTSGDRTSAFYTQAQLRNRR